MKSKHRIGSISAIALIAAAGWLGWEALFRDSDSTGSMLADRQGEIFGSADEEATEVFTKEPAPASAGNWVASTMPSTPAAVQLARSAPLPGVLPPAQLVELLEPRARAGDAAAACRLAAELVICRTALKWPAMSDAQIAQELEQLSQIDGVTAERIQRSRHDYEARNLKRSECETIPASVRRQESFFHLQAARQGHVGSMVAFAYGAGLTSADLVADPDLYQLYRQNAFPLWRQALQAGSVEAVHVWSQVLSSREPLILAGVLPDEYQDPGLATALLAEINAAMGFGSSTPTMAEIPELTRRKARVLFDRYFAGSEQLSQVTRRLAESSAQSTVPNVSGPPSAEQRVEQMNEYCRNF